MVGTLHTYPDSTLAILIEHWTLLETRRRKELDYASDTLRELQTELRRRQLEAFWQSNEGLRLAVGDRLLVTEETLQTVMDNAHTDDLSYDDADITVRVGDGATYVGWYDAMGGKRFRVRLDSSVLSIVTLDIARRMRVAWLEQQGEAQS